MADTITLTKPVKATPQRVYQAFLEPTDLTQWHHASEGWTTPWARVDATPGGRLAIRFEDPTGKNSFDLEGVFNELIPDELIDYTMTDGRRVLIHLAPADGGTLITQTFDAEDQMSIDVQRQGWMSLLDQLARYLESAG